MSRIGVLALQGGYAAHCARLKQLGHTVVEVRKANDLDGLSGLCLPGGESTTQMKLIERWDLADALSAFIAGGQPVLATCAGTILAARQVTEPEQKSYGWLNISVERNGWGRQLDSFEATADDGKLPIVFIRAPRITRIGPGVEILATYNDEPIMVRQGNITAATFHPELTNDLQIHARVFGRAEG